MDVARLNLSHGTHGEHERTYRLVREEADRAGRAVGVLVDLQGPKIRLGAFRSPPVLLVPGTDFTITTRPVLGDATICSTTYAGLPGDVSPGETVLLDDGRVRLDVLDVSATDVSTRVVVGGELSNAKGINLPGARVSAPAMSVKDFEDLRWALRLRADLVALSFVRCAEDVDGARQVMTEVGEHVPVLAKIEKPQAVENIAAILGSFDGLMVARGDLGVELPLEDVPVVQKELVERARGAAKPVIVATQMLESMISAPRPTRAEASDVANAVLDGADAVMLSAETSVGRYPTEAALTMARIISSTEDHWLHRTAAITWTPKSRGGVITKAAAEVAERIGARYLVAFTQSGDTARRLSRYRSRVPILAFTPDPAVRSQLTVSWGVETFLVPAVRHTDEMVSQVDRALLEIGRCDVGDEVVLVAGSPPGIPGSTNAVRIHRMGDAINEVVDAYRGSGAPGG
jgi:pyruvate kinase